MKGMTLKPGAGYFGPAAPKGFSQVHFNDICRHNVPEYPEGKTFYETMLEVQETILQQDADETIQKMWGYTVRAGTAIMRPGLHKHTGAWAICHGLINPVIIVDPQTPIEGGHNALIAHEAYHAQRRHRLKQIATLCVPVLGWLAYPLLCARHEVLADAAALSTFGNQEFMAFLHLHKEPTTWWGRFKYGYSRAIRMNRAEECLGREPSQQVG